MELVVSIQGPRSRPANYGLFILHVRELIFHVHRFKSVKFQFYLPLKTPQNCDQGDILNIKAVLGTYSHTHTQTHAHTSTFAVGDYKTKTTGLPRHLLLVHCRPSQL